MQILQQHSSLDYFSYKQQEKETSKTSLGWTIPCFQLFIAPVLLCSCAHRAPLCSWGYKGVNPPHSLNEKNRSGPDLERTFQSTLHKSTEHLHPRSHHKEYPNL